MKVQMKIHQTNHDRDFILTYGFHETILTHR